MEEDYKKWNVHVETKAGDSKVLVETEAGDSKAQVIADLNFNFNFKSTGRNRRTIVKSTGGGGL